MKKALVVWGGLEMHESEAGAEVIRLLLEPEGYHVTVTGDLEALGAADVGEMDLIVPQVTGMSLSRESSIVFEAAVRAGTGLAGFHHGLATSFHGNMRIRFMAGVTFASHPGNIITYRIDPGPVADPIMEGIGSFEHVSEQYYLHVDPAITDVLATTTFSGEHAPWRTGVVMPQVVKSSYGKARVFYTALGHVSAELEKPEIRTILKRGLLWATR
jgi:type 1 glutamine amidotransferase